MTIDQTIAGHRVLRLLATGVRSRVWLAPGDRVLKVVPPGDAGREALALHRARGEHVVELLDAAVDDDRAVLVFPRLPRGSLADVLAGRAGLDAGEAVTALAPIAAALARMHGAGVAHGSLMAGHVLFREDGAPVLIGFGSAQAFEAGLPEFSLERVEGVMADRGALAALAAELLARVTGPRAAAAAALATRLSEAGLGEFEVNLGRELFELAAARPVRLDPEPDPGLRRAVGVAEVREPDEPDSSGHPGPVHEVVSALLESGAGVVVRRIVKQRWQAWSATQRRVAVGVGAGAAVLAVAIAAIPSPDAPADPGRDVVTASPAPQETSGEFAPSSVAGDDPLAAVSELLRRRTECYRDLSMLCFDDVDEQGSSALDADRSALDGLTADGVQPLLIDSDGATIVERLGDSVLVALAPGSEPASVLLLKGEAGWRIRDYIAARGGG